MKNLFLSLLLYGLFLNYANAQEAPKVKFEKVSDEEMVMKTFPNDTTADAAILYDEGSSYVRYDDTKGFVLTYERFVRIKILKQSGVEWGNFNISLYSSDKTKEDIGLLKGTTMNLEKGKVVKSDLKKDAVFRTRENKYWEAVSFAMPAVKVGSVMDLHYRIYSDKTWNLRTWKFQYGIPVKWSQYSITYPEYFHYNESFLGYFGISNKKESQKRESIIVNESESTSTTGDAGLTAIERKTVSHNISYESIIHEYAAKDIPSIKAEPYLTSLDNYATQLKFELASTNYTTIGGKFTSFTTSWSELSKQLIDEDNFGEELKHTGFIEDVVTGLTKGTSSDIVRLNKIYDYVQHYMKWDGYKAVFTNKSLKNGYSDKSGNSADINLLLVAMLKKAGIETYPVILSTRENGILSIAHPTISDCNYVIAQAVIDGNKILLDATEPDLQPGTIPFRCLNGEGHRISQEESEPVELRNNRGSSRTTIMLELTNGIFTGKVTKGMSGLNAFNFRKSVRSDGGNKENFDKLKNNSPEIEYLEYQYSNLDSLYLPISIKYDITLKEKPDTTAEIIYINPVLMVRQSENPFKSPVRNYPVDYGLPFVEYYNLQLTIPNGYVVEELPETKFLALEEKGGQFQYGVTQVGDKILVNFNFSINKSMFLPSEYLMLKSFYDLVINKEAEQIVLKKKKI